MPIGLQIGAGPFAEGTILRAAYAYQQATDWHTRTGSRVVGGPATKMVRKAIIPAAGLGTRFLPVTRSVPKELLPILDRPMLQYVVAEAAEAGIGEVIVVTSPGKEGIADYFRSRPDLEARLADDENLLNRVRSGTDLAEVSFVIQQEPLGLGHAVLTGPGSGGR